MFNKEAYSMSLNNNKDFKYYYYLSFISLF